MKVQLNTDMKTLDLGRSICEDKFSATKGNSELKMGNSQQNDFVSQSNSSTPWKTIPGIYSGADKSLARPGRKQATATEDFDVQIFYL
jgi:hypothetical protein